MNTRIWYELKQTWCTSTAQKKELHKLHPSCFLCNDHACEIKLLGYEMKLLKKASMNYVASYFICKRKVGLKNYTDFMRKANVLYLVWMINLWKYGGMRWRNYIWLLIQKELKTQCRYSEMVLSICAFLQCNLPRKFIVDDKITYQSHIFWIDFYIWL
jgi:hypothetical protein